MTKKQKLVIPNHYREILADYFSEYDGMVVIPTKNDNEFAVYPGADVHLTLIDIPKELQSVLLQEIKGGPVSSYDVARACYDNASQLGEPSAFEIALVTEGEKNDRKRTQPVIDAAISAKKEIYDYWNSNKDCFTGKVYKKLVRALKQLKEQDND
jgi:hypothetical protein